MFNWSDRWERKKKWSAAWSLLAVLVFVTQGLGSSLFCHEDSSHDHSSHSHDSVTTHQETGHHHGGLDAENHHHANSAAQGESHSSSASLAPASLPDRSNESCCCQPDNSPALTAAPAFYSAPTGKNFVPSPMAAELPPIFLLEVSTAVHSRAGPSVPSVISQLRRSSLLNRAPPISA
jgi:hypothetical protein